MFPSALATYGLAAVCDKLQVQHVPRNKTPVVFTQRDWSRGKHPAKYV